MRDIDRILDLAAKLPAGLPDSGALEKLTREYKELDEALDEGDILGAILEGGDVAYYACKLLNLAAHRIDRVAGNEMSIGVSDLIVACQAKYALRAQPGNPKDDAAEREAVRRALNLRGGDAID